MAALLLVMVLTTRIGVVHSATTIIDNMIQPGTADWTQVFVSNDLVNE
jgi:hypothetical protein